MNLSHNIFHLNKELDAINLLHRFLKIAFTDIFISIFLYKQAFIFRLFKNENASARNTRKFQGFYNVLIIKRL
jgi:hypothetical protein